MHTCAPVIGVIVADGSVIQIGYVPVFSDKLPPLQHLLDLLMAMLSWAEVGTGEVTKSEWTHVNCSPSPAARRAWGTSHE